MEQIINKVAQQHCKIAVIGQVDSGKSTLVGVLTKGELDNGRGSARLKVFNFDHEKENGRTSSIAHEIIGFDGNGKQYLPKRFNQNKNSYWADIVEHSKKVVQVFDLCGHEKYLKTTMFGLTGLIPDYCMIIIASNNGFPKMTKEHLGITVSLKIPFFIIVTKEDICPPNVFKETVDDLKKTLKIQFIQRIPIDIKPDHKDQELQVYADQMPSNRICPIFNIQNTNGKGISELLKFIFLLNNRDNCSIFLKKPSDPIEFAVNEDFIVNGRGVVITGILRSGCIKLNQVLLLGPDKQQQFQQVIVKGIHVNRVGAEQALIGEFSCLLIKPAKSQEQINRNLFRKGMVAIDPSLPHETYQEFEADVVILHHGSTIQPNYQSVIHCGVVRQTAKVKFIYNATEIKTGQKGLIRFRFLFYPEYIKIGLPILFREGRTKILGIITRVLTQQEIDLENKELQYKTNPMSNKQTEESKKQVQVQYPQQQSQQLQPQQQKQVQTQQLQQNQLQQQQQQQVGEEKKSETLVEKSQMENINQDLKTMDSQYKSKNHRKQQKQRQKKNSNEEDKQNQKTSKQSSDISSFQEKQIQDKDK